MRGWWELIRERFPPGSYLPMVTLFVAGNGGVATAALAAPAVGWRFAAAFLLALLFFFRLRCFDEIKDYETDLVINPTRPLPRGAVSVPAVKRMILALAVVELALAVVLGLPVLAVHVSAVVYSFLMYGEFFIGKHLRPHLTTYAITHTFVSILLGFSVAAAVTGARLWPLPTDILLVGLANWCLFNLFEFARKTHAPDEERPHVESYSKIFRPIGAVILSLSQVAVAVLLVRALHAPRIAASPVEWQWHLVPAGLLALTALAFAFTARSTPARVFRGTTGLYIVTFYALLAFASLG